MATIRSFWYGGALSPYVSLCLCSFVVRGHRFILYSYEKIDVPRGVELVDAASVLGEDEVFLYQYGAAVGSPSAFSNLFRYELLRRFGDWWCDTDMLCLGEQLPDQELVFGFEDLLRINGAVLKTSPGHVLAETLLVQAKLLGSDIRWGEAGPQLVSRVIKELNLESHALERDAFYPLHWSEALWLFDPQRTEEVEERVRTSHMVHFWNEVLRREPLSQHVGPPPGSFLHAVFQKYGISFPSGLAYSAYEIGRFVENSKRLRELRTELEATCAERDAVREERDAAVAGCQALRRRLEHAKITG